MNISVSKETAALMGITHLLIKWAVCGTAAWILFGMGWVVLPIALIAVSVISLSFNKE